MIFELRRQGGLMKLIFNESHGMYSDKTAEAINNINSFVSKLERIVFNDK